MPAIVQDSHSKILLTGGTGYMGIWILKTLLDQGFSVKAVVRNESKITYLRDKFIDQASQLEFVIIEDFSAPNAFDEVVKGVTGIIHNASPVVLSHDPNLDANDLIRPAVGGTLSLLNSALKSPTIQRVVVTSSTGAVLEPKPFPAVYTEDDWFVSSAKAVEEQGLNASLLEKYSASKYLAETAAWDWMKNKKPAFDLVTILPCYTWGSVINETTSDIKTAVAFLLNPLKKSALEALDPSAPISSQSTGLLQHWQIVDIRDISAHHVQALVHPQAGGDRFLSSAGVISLQHILDILNENPIEGISVPKGDPNVLKGWVPSFGFSNKRIKEVMGVTYRPMSETVRDSIIHALELGWSQ